MLEACYVALRWVHFSALMVVLGGAICSALLAPTGLRRMINRRLSPLWLAATLCALASSLLLWAVQGGLMAGGWGDVISPATWILLLGSTFGAVWLWQIILALVTLLVYLLRPYRFPPLLLLLSCGQLLLLSGVGHGALHEGALGVIGRISYGLHLLAAGWWVGGLLPLLICMHLATRPRWHHYAVLAMMRFSRYGHLAVAGVIVTGVVNGLLILGPGWPALNGYVQLLLIKTALVGVMVLLAVFNRYWLVPRFSLQGERAIRQFIVVTRIELLLSVAVLALVSLFATWDPF